MPKATPGPRSGADVRAPAAGRVVDLRVHSAGGVVAAGQPILDIVPDRVPLEIRASFAPEDIDGVFEGREAEVKFLSLHDRDLPIVLGIVLCVALALLLDGLIVLGARLATPWQRAVAAR